MDTAERLFAAIMANLQLARRGRSSSAIRHLDKAPRQLSHPLERQAAPLAQAAVDYLLASNLAIAPGSSAGQSLRSILRGLEHFAVEQTQWDDAVVSLFGASWEAVNRSPQNHAADPTSSSLYEGAVAGVSAWLTQQCRNGACDQPEVFQDVLQLSCRVLSAVLRCIATQDKTTYPAPAHLSRDLAPALLTVFSDKTSPEVSGVCQAIIGAGWISRITEAVWRIARNFPDAFTTDHPPVESWLARLIAEVAHPSEKGPHVEPLLVAEAVCQLLAHGMADLPLLVRHPSTRKLFLTSALRSLLEVLVATLPGLSLPVKAALSREETNQLIASMLGAWQAHPDWLFRRTGHQERAATLLPILIQALTELDVGIIKALLRVGRVQGLLGSTLVSGLSGKLSSFNSGKVSSILNQLISELLPQGLTGLDLLLEGGRLTDLLTAIAASKIADKLFSEADDAVRQACRNIVAVVQDFRSGQVIPLPELIERLNRKA